MKNSDCQLKSVHYIAIGPQEAVPIRKNIRLYVRKKLGPSKVKKIKKFINDIFNLRFKASGKSNELLQSIAENQMFALQPGDLVRVRSKEEIVATLDHWGQLRGCSFAPEMGQYCSTTQKVLKRVERFVDERDLVIRKTKGIVLLDGIICHGTISLGSCDRNCLYFWREEWLEKISDDNISL
jgi:hypothetical protein